MAIRHHPLSDAKFPKGLIGAQLPTRRRPPMWKNRMLVEVPAKVLRLIIIATLRGFCGRYAAVMTDGKRVHFLCHSEAVTP